MGRSHSLRRRRIAVTTCVLWLLAVELLPNLHLARHRADHTHDASGARVDHDDHHHDIAPVPVPTEDRERSGELAITGPITPGHAAAGVSHRALALHAPPPPLLAPLVARAAWWQTTTPIERAGDGNTPRPTARGPPA